MNSIAFTIVSILFLHNFYILSKMEVKYFSSVNVTGIQPMTPVQNRGLLNPILPGGWGGIRPPLVFPPPSKTAEGIKLKPVLT